MTTATEISSSLAQSTALDKELDNVIGTALALNRIVGTVIMVAQQGEIVYQRAAGFADREARTLAQPNTIFRFASLTKPIVTTAALALVDQGKLGLDDQVSKWIPEFRPRLPDGREPVITIRHLLTHTSGLSYAFKEEAEGPYHRANVSDGLDQPGLGIAENLERLALVPFDTMTTNQIGDFMIDPERPGWGFGFGAAVLKDPLAAQTPQTKGTFSWGGVYGHSWFVDPHLELSVVELTNTTIEGMAGVFTVAVRDAVYRTIAG